MIFHPIVIFTYKRCSITRLVINSLLANPEANKSDLVIYSDGPKSESDKIEVEEVRNYLKEVKGFNSIELKFRTRNLGLAGSFITGITETLDRFESAIFMEDDNLVSPGFLKFMNLTLEHYKDNINVSCITGYSYPLWPQQNRPYFVRGAETWSMATWRRSWQLFCDDGNFLKNKIDENKLVCKFSRDGNGFYQMLEEQISEKIDSWGIRWTASAFVNDMYCLYPNKPLCVSIGYGIDSVHCKVYNPLFRKSTDLVNEIGLSNLPAIVKETLTTTILIMLMNRIIFKIQYLYIKLANEKSLRNVIRLVLKRIK